MEDPALRYARQTMLENFGTVGQAKLKAANVLVAGAGGLGSAALYYLAAAGVGTLGIVDDDTVTLSNLNRQIIHFEDDLGRAKTDSAAEKLRAFNHDVNLVRHPNRLTRDNIEGMIGAYDIIIDATDNFAARYLISDSCFFLNKPVVEGAVSGYEGILMTVIPGTTPCYRCLYPIPPEGGDLAAAGHTGILGAVAGTIGTLQALEVIKLITGIGATLSGRILRFDGLTAGFREIPWPRRSECPLCGDHPTVTGIS